MFKCNVVRLLQWHPRVLFTIMGILLFMVGCGEQEEKEDNTILSKEVTEVKSISEVEALVKSNCLDDTQPDESTLFYQQNNQLALDLSMPWNKGTEPLSEFVKKFRSDARYRKIRLALQEGVYNPRNISEYAFVISAPDSTGFFSAWSYVSIDSAAFCIGWMDSEVLEEFGIVRADSTQNWKLVNYYHAT